MKQIWMWTEDERDGWVGEHDTRESALEEIKTISGIMGFPPDEMEVLLVPVDGDQVEEGKELVFLGPKERITLQDLVAA